MAAPAWRAGSVSSLAAQTSYALAKPTGTATGDVLVIALSVICSVTPTITGPAGWTTKLNTGGSSAGFAVFTRQADGTEGAGPYTVSLSSSTIRAEVTIQGFQPGAGFSATDVDAFANGTPDSGGVNTTFTAPSVTTTGTDRLIARIFQVANLTARTWTPPASHTENFDSGGTEIATVAQAVAGASGTATATASGTGNVIEGYTLAINNVVTGTLYTMTLTADIIYTAAVSRQVARALAATTALTATVARSCSRSLAATITWGATVKRAVSRSLAATTPLTASLTPSRVKHVVLTCGFVLGATVARQPRRTLQAQTTLTATYARALTRTLAATTALTATRARRVTRGLAATTTWSAALVALPPARIVRTVLGVARRALTRAAHRQTAPTATKAALTVRLARGDRALTKTATKARPAVMVELSDKPLNP